MADDPDGSRPASERRQVLRQVGVDAHSLQGSTAIRQQARCNFQEGDIRRGQQRQSLRSELEKNASSTNEKYIFEVVV